MNTPHAARPDEPAYAHLREILQTLAGLEADVTDGVSRREAYAAIRRRTAAALEQLEALEPDTRRYPVDAPPRPMRRRAALQSPAPEVADGAPVHALACPTCHETLFAVNDDGHARCYNCRERLAVRLWVEREVSR